ncbi:unnamed protein product [Acanthoscelides obtectus]|uniref:Uncharacterized protein n=1 Tax=Acanthoscelides obtectus TaxID=200917 RepID=A0A9P0LXZ9_ACAOB|nr:unnamed protein product [Acanthoscelides obtectus]CAK1629899.1 hypothetical protein AOBTE_LOCUS6024 [Acanthoscelides obtectus]
MIAKFVSKLLQFLLMSKELLLRIGIPPLFAKSHHRASKNQPRKKNHPPPRQCKLAHSPKNNAVFNGRKRGIIGPSSI